MKKILHLLSTGKVSGAENVAMGIIEGLRSKNDFIYVSLNGEVKETLRKRNIKYKFINKTNYLSIKKIVKQYKPDIIHAHDFKASIIAALFSKNIKIISHIHQSPKWLEKQSIKTIAFLISTYKFEKIIFVDENTKMYREINKKNLKKYTVIKNSVNIESVKIKASEEYDDEKYHLVFVGRLCDVKNPLRLIKIINNIVNIKNDIKLAIIGDGDLREQCESLIKKLKLNKNIKMYGFLNNPFKVINNSKVLITTSRSEGNPLALIEALSLNKPLIVPNISSMQKFADNGVALICGNDYEYEKNIIHILSDDKLYGKLSGNTKVYIKNNFDFNMHLKSISDIYESF